MKTTDLHSWRNPDEVSITALLDIYRQSFPADERVEESQLLRSLEEGTRQLACSHVSGHLAAFAITIRLDPTVTLVEYLAASPALRGQGVGGRLLDWVIAESREIAESLVLEVDDPKDPSINSAERSLRERRIGFYRSHGGVLLPCPEWYGAPAMNSGTPIRMVLMHFALSPAAHVDWRQVLEAIFPVCYGRALTDSDLAPPAD